MIRNVLILLAPLYLTLVECWPRQIISLQNDFGLTPIEPSRADEIEWREHPCRRTCKDGAAPMKCYYTFIVEAYYTMSKACYDCPFNVTDCHRPHCVPADGVKRSVIVVNRQMPGPAIEVCQGDRVVVDVVNSLASESTTMHWHGQHQLETPYMDGVPYVSQCPIPPGATFRYDYVASEAGTHFWHSHSGFQRGDGLYGPLIVRVPPGRDYHYDAYDYDEHTMLVTDWAHQMGIDKFLAHHHAGGDNKAPNLLVNGLGPFRKIESANGTSADMPLAVFDVKQGFRYRIRLINAEFLNCPIEVSVDNHTLSVLSADGRDIELVRADSFVSYAGERFDFVIETDQEVGNYWIRFRGLMDCDARFLSAHQVAILRYEGAKLDNPSGDVKYDYEAENVTNVRINALNEGTETNTSLSIPLLNATDNSDESYIDKPDYQFYISYDFYGKNNPHFHRSNFYEFNQVKSRQLKLFTPQLNHISLKLPPFPIFSQRDMIDQRQFCNSSTVEGCENDYCACTHVIQIKYGSTVELVLVDEGVTYDANHPFHLHGYQFRVVAMEKVGPNTTVEEIKRLDADGLIHRKLTKAPLKDTVTVPDGGYTIIRFLANNPGYWLFHCHIEFHAEVGMALIFKVGEHEEMAKVPADFPRCGRFEGSDNEIPDREVVSSTTTSPSIVAINSLENEISKTFREIKNLLPILSDVFHSSSTASRISDRFFFVMSVLGFVVVKYL